MAGQIITALWIARPLAHELAGRPFSGQVWGVFNRACNLVDAERRIVALTLPEVGRGPFAVTVPGSPGLFNTLAPGQPASADAHRVTVGPWQILLDNAPVWEPALPLAGHAFKPEFILTLTKPYLDWPNFYDNTPVNRHMAALARQSADQLAQALAIGNKPAAIAAALQLAGLGHGLTPAGDDFLLGALAALWFAGRADNCPPLAQAAAAKTTALSAAFLQAADRGEFMEPWHILAQTWAAQNTAASQAALDQIARFGASSGRDALAGFAAAMAAIVKNRLSFGK
jgi:hypothetical protein